jgi:hypothetical protein
VNDPAGEKAPPTLLDSESVRAVLVRLVEAQDMAVAFHKNPWEFAVELASLTTLDVNHSQIRWLISEGLVEPRVETISGTARRRTFRKLHSLALPERTCLVLTDCGQQAAARIAPDLHRAPIDRPSGTGSSEPPAPDRPHWDAQRRQLSFQGQLVKVFRVPAPNQEAILAAFEEAGWPHCVADPLESKADQVAKQRLPNTIRALNRCQSRPSLRFHGDGTGSRICWGVVSKRCGGVVPESTQDRTLSER